MTTYKKSQQSKDRLVALMNNEKNKLCKASREKSQESKDVLKRLMENADMNNQHEEIFSDIQGDEII